MNGDATSGYTGHLDGRRWRLWPGVHCDSCRNYANYIEREDGRLVRRCEDCAYEEFSARTRPAWRDLIAAKP